MRNTAKIAAIKAIYLRATQQSIQSDVKRAIEILKTIDSEEDRQRAAVYMEGLSVMRSEWSALKHSRRVSKPNRS